MTDTNKMRDQSREQFEAWYLAEYYEGDKQCGLEWLSTEPCGDYRYAEPSREWKVWQASRQAVVVELPFLYPVYRQEVKSAIEAQGLRVGGAEMSEWISIHDERKPEQRCDVLVSVKYVRHRENEDGSPCDEEGSEVAMGEYVPVCGHVLAYFDSYSAPHGDDWWITHWMALPSPADEGVQP